MGDSQDNLHRVAEDLGAGLSGFALSDLIAYSTGADNTWVDEIEERMKTDDRLAQFVATIRARANEADHIDTSRIEALHAEIDRAVRQGRWAVEQLPVADRPAWYQSRVRFILTEWPNEKPRNILNRFLGMNPARARLSFAVVAILGAVFTYRLLNPPKTPLASYPEFVQDLVALYSQNPPDRVARSGSAADSNTVLASPNPDDFTLPTVQPTFQWSSGEKTAVRLVEVDDLGNVLGRTQIPLAVDGNSARVTKPLVAGHFYLWTLVGVKEGKPVSESIVFRAPTPEDGRLLSWAEGEGISDPIARGMVLFKAGFTARAVSTVSSVTNVDFVDPEKFSRWKAYFEETLAKRRQNRRQVILP